MRLVFMGTPDFAVPVLAALLEAGHEIILVYSQPPRPTGRGQKSRPSPIQTYAENHGLSVRTPIDLELIEEQAKFSKLDVDVGIVVAYGLKLPASVFNAPRFGCLNVHASLLPRWRGAAPIQRAILAGDSVTGVSIMKIEEGLDTGQVYSKEKIKISDRMNSQSLHDVLAKKGAGLMVEVLKNLEAGILSPKSQKKDGVTYAGKLRSDEGKIDWSRSAEDLERQVRALNPWPGVWFEFGVHRLKVIAVEVDSDVKEVDAFVVPGTLIDNSLGVACGSGVLRLSKLCRAGKKVQNAEAFLRGFPIAVGSIFK